MTGFASGRYPRTDNPALTKHVDVLDRFDWDGGSTPPASTILTAMGISPKTAYEVEKRPFFATKDGTEKPAMDIFA